MFVQGRRLAVPAAMIVGLIALTGCDQEPSVAAQVGGSSISTHDVDLMTQVLCVDHAHAPQQQGKLPVASVRSQALHTLIEAELNRKFAAKEHLPSADTLVSQQMAGFDKLFGALPAGDRAPTEQLVRKYFTGEIQLQQLGAFVLQHEGKKVDAQSATQVGLAQRKQFDAKQDIEINPRYATSGGSGAGQQALSVPVSSFAKSASSQSPPPSWSAGLPANQVCG